MSRRFSPLRLIEERERVGKSRQDLADATRRSWWSVYGWERGSAAPPANTLARIADALECRIDDLFVEEGRSSCG